MTKTYHYCTVLCFGGLLGLVDSQPFFSHVERLKWYCSVYNVILLVIVCFVTICFEAQNCFVIIHLMTVFVL
jgi:hypothetical protein